jgi:hypothetical protein
MNQTRRKEKREEEPIVQPKRGLSMLIFATIIIFLLLFSIGSLMFLAIRQGKGARLTNGIQTPTPTSTAMDLETPPPQAVFYDTFKNNAQGWGLLDSTGFVRTLQDGQLILANTSPNTTLIESLPTNAIYGNFTVSIDLTIIKAGRYDSAGFYVRGDGDLNHDYRIEINGDNTFDIAKEYLDARNSPRSMFLAGPISSSVLKSLRTQNTIRLVMTGPQLLLFINNIEVSSVVDGDYTTGQVALFAHAGRDSKGVTVSYSRVEVDQQSKR